MQVLTNLNLNKNELQNVVLQNLASAPANPKEGQMYYNTVDKQAYQYKGEGKGWEAIGAPYNLPIASTEILGGVKVGTGLGIKPDGKLYVTGEAAVSSVEWSAVKNTPKTVKGYGITDAVVDTSKKSVKIGDGELTNLVSDASYVHTDNNFTAEDKSKLDGLDKATLENKIETISVNKQNVAPDGKNVDITVPTKVGDLENDSKFITAAGAPVQSVNGGTGAVTITSESINAVPTSRTINKKDLSKNIDLTATDVGALPSTGGTLTGELKMSSQKITGLADATDPQGAVTKKQLEEAVAAIGTVFDFKGSKPNKKSLPLTGEIGDVWYVEDEKVGYIWINDSKSEGRWEQLGPTVNLTGYLTKAGLLKTTGSAEDNTMTQKAITDELKKKADATTVSAIPVIKIATGTISSSQTSVAVSFSGTYLMSSVKDAANEEVIVDKVIGADSVTFSIANAVKGNLTCQVCYY